MKRFKLLTVILVLVIVFSAVGCSPDDNEDSQGGGETHEGFIVACLGDSITEGVGVDTEEERYTVLLSKKEGITSVQNVGFSGAFIGYTNSQEHSYMNAYSFLKRYKKIKEETDLIFVFGGTNDYGSNMGCNPLGQKSDQTDSTFYGALKLLIAGLKEKYPNAQLLFATPLQRDDVWCKSPLTTPYNASGNTLEEYRNAIIEVCGDNNIEYIDLYNLENMRLTDENYKDYLKDGLHPNAKGNALIAEAVYAKIKTMANLA